MNRRAVIGGLACFGIGMPPSSYAQSLRSSPPPRLWIEIPSLAVVSKENDPRLPAVREAVSFWNAELSSLGSAFRLGDIMHVAGAIPDSELFAANDAAASRTLNRADASSIPDSIRRVNANVIVALSSAKFFDRIAFTMGWPVFQKALVAVQSEQTYPLTLSSGPRNVIAHELGHVIGLGHNNDDAALMCTGGWCHAIFPGEGFFPLTGTEEVKLLEMYPPNWQPDPRRRPKADPPAWIPG